MSKQLDVSYFPLLDYAEAWEMQKSLVKEIDGAKRNETLLLLQHPATFTIGSQKHPEHLLWNEQQLRDKGIAVFEIDRGGDITYHGPGQLVGYPLLALDAENMDLHGYLRNLEQVIINYLAKFGITGGRKPEYTGVWVGNEKIAAIGVKFNKRRQRRGFITSHGFAFNVASGIQHEGFTGIIPCGIEEYGVTSLEDCTGQRFAVQDVARELLPCFVEVFGYEPVIEGGLV
ncbi:Octanoyltransferase [Paenibacillus sp. CECT 9249]|uniref:lipoyl(octanoyl) transferase LipB n=1 Tax=Paenibacillus sp. CECT 9249 TaxID=2845385 RepID=UPI001E3E1D3B|nr:lipoyl(octanoyl) transferase LipB [Paenibacillus sp. CECT 9249]CAH0118623.1 Octanoyltransferase [Paenibacillus sp. CECT 9249]